jgi:hypothetical protein
MNVEKHDIRAQVRDPGDRLGYRTGLADYDDRRQIRVSTTSPVQFSFYPGPEQRVVVHQEHADAFRHGYVSSPPLRREMAS